MTRKGSKNNLTGTKTRERAGRTPSRRKPKRVLSDWMVVRVKHNRERYARRNVERQGGKVFIPWIWEEGDRAEQPLFPGHIFVQGPAWYYLQNTYGVLGPILMAGEPAYMPLKEMRAIMKAGDKEGVITIKRQKPVEVREDFVKGQRVTGQKGPWQRQIGVYIRDVGQERVRVLFRLLGANHEIELKRAEVTAAPPEEKDKTS